MENIIFKYFMMAWLWYFLHKKFKWKKILYIISLAFYEKCCFEFEEILNKYILKKIIFKLLSI